MTRDTRPDPDALLARIRREEEERRESGRGHLRIYLGAFPGVGKTYAMLNEAQRRKVYGEDVVVGYVETHGRRSTAIQVEGLEVVPRKRIEYGGVTVEEMDVEAILKRKPAVCLVDEIAHTNAPGSDREKRYEDVQVLLDAGIDVVSTLNVQHLESLNDTVESITGIQVRETVPDSVLDEADEVILIDLSPEGARARMQHGHIYPPEQARQALQNFFRAENLAALRELALRRTAQEVDDQLEEYMREAKSKTGLTERVVVLLDETSGARTVLRHAWRLAQGFDAELLAAYVVREALNDQQERELSRTLELAEDLNARVIPIKMEDARIGLPALLEAEGVTHAVLPRQRQSLLTRLRQRSLADEIAAAVPSVDVHLVGVD
jgi:two-component system sensor histidine kinase KdpD